MMKGRSFKRVLLVCLAGMALCGCDSLLGIPESHDTSVDGGAETQAESDATEVADSCGNGAIDDDNEECDGTQFDEATCNTATEGHAPDGQIGCTDDCKYDPSACHDCGNGVKEADEECDGDDFGSASCETEGYAPGALRCVDCQIVPFDCPPLPTCQDGDIDAGEECEADLSGEGSCESETAGTRPEGALGCTDGCQYDTDGCYLCGDGKIDEPEVCDGANVAGQTCADHDGDDGALRCQPDCLGFDLSDCSTCGDGAVEGPEQCDGSVPDGRTCATEGAYSGGTLECEDCRLTTLDCTEDKPTVPSVRRPAANAYTGFGSQSRRPTFAWTAATGPAGTPISYEIELSTSPDFAPAVTTMTPVAATTYAPAADLPVSATVPVGTRYYWRVKARAGGVLSDPSAVRIVNVGRSIHDLDGDGYDDLAIGSDGGGSAVGNVRIYFGSASGLPSTAERTLNGEDTSSYFGASVAKAGDVNGDGFGDLIVSAFKFSGTAGKVYLYLGGPRATFSVASAQSFSDGGTGSQFGRDVAGAGDVNGDGRADVLVGANLTKRVYLYEGTAFGLSAGPAQIFERATGSSFGVAVAGAGDVDSDGFDDVLVGDSGAGGNAGKAYLYRGGADPVDTTPDAETAIGVAESTRGGAVAAAGDLNGDGFADLVVGAPMEDVPGAGRGGRAYIYFGSVAPELWTAEGTIAGDDSSAYMGYSVVGCDVDGDTFSDVAAAAYGHNSVLGGDAGRTSVVRGGSGPGFGGVPYNLDGTATPQNAGFDVTCADYDADGDGDLVATSPILGNLVFVFPGHPRAEAPPERLTLFSPVPSDRFGMSAQ